MANKGNCKAENCDKPVHGKGYCERHYRKWRKGLLGKPRYKICNEEGCRKPQGARRALCDEHFAKKHTKAAPEAAAPTPAAEPAAS